MLLYTNKQTIFENLTTEPNKNHAKKGQKLVFWVLVWLSFMFSRKLSSLSLFVMFCWGRERGRSKVRCALLSALSVMFWPSIEQDRFRLDSHPLAQTEVIRVEWRLYVCLVQTFLYNGIISAFTRMLYWIARILKRLIHFWEVYHFLVRSRSKLSGLLFSVETLSSMQNSHWWTVTICFSLSLSL